MLFCSGEFLVRDYYFISLSGGEAGGVRFTRCSSRDGRVALNLCFSPEGTRARKEGQDPGAFVEPTPLRRNRESTSGESPEKRAKITPVAL